MLENVFEGLNARSEVYSQRVFLRNVPDCLLSRICFSLCFFQHLACQLGVELLYVSPLIKPLFQNFLACQLGVKNVQIYEQR